MLDSIYHMTSTFLKNRILAWKRQDFAIFSNILMDVIT